MLRPREWTDKWFNLLVLHQNRAKHGLTDYIPEDFLDEFLDLVVWGHEHECLIEPEFNGRFHVTQPGSPVATSLCPGSGPQPKLPLIRLRVEHGIDHETFSPHLLARIFTGRVANLRDIVLFTKRRGTVGKDDGAVDLNCLQEIANPEALARSRVEDLVREYFETVDETLHMTVLTDAAMQRAMNLFVDKDCTDAIMGAIKMQEVGALKS
ncbi:hypothetical protein HPB49_020495 [Dermacentor silvarum]|uniref:Uncharacterized protein n=1 Tax=Dermacentor silvarum TaxID=543639 RepID=A0ACB8CT38_DERSI|nr:hypothetical protein HPB49_020495 [Dermacentor silvarum]